VVEKMALDENPLHDVVPPSSSALNGAAPDDLASHTRSGGLSSAGEPSSGSSARETFET
jgi:hypothetical protein